MRISDWSSDVCSSDLGQYFLADADIVEIISRGDPHAQNVRAAFGDDLQRIDDIAQRFGHFTALLVERKAMGKSGVIRCAAACAAAFEQGGLGPAAMLVGAFEVAVGANPCTIACLDSNAVRRASVEPAIENIDHDVLGLENVMRKK